MSSIVAEMFNDIAVCVLRIQEGRIIYRNDIVETLELTTEIVHRAAGLASIGARPRLNYIEAELSPRLLGLVRFFGDSALIVVAEREDRNEARFRLEQFNRRDLHLFGGGLSNTALDPDAVFGQQDAAPVGGPCTAAAVAAFLNESFDFLFSLSSQSLRVAYCRSFGNRYAYLKAKGGVLIATDELHILDEGQRKDLDHKFARMVEAIDMQKLESLSSSPITSPPWRAQARLKPIHRAS